MNQQGQALSYFKSHAEEWNEKAVDKNYSLIDNRHNAVLEVMKKFPRNSSLLDLGCGSGQLAIHASKMGWSALGVDFAEEMIDICHRNNECANANAKFVCRSVLDTEWDFGAHDVISAQGFIEYISLNQLENLLSTAHKNLNKNGMLALGTRNRLFNLHSLNSFTELELVLGTVTQLLTECIAIQSAASQEQALERLAAMVFEYEQPSTHPITGVTVNTRYQFSPADLIAKLKRHKFKATKIYPVHFHAFPVGDLSDINMEMLHKELASLGSNSWINNHRLIPYSSSFVIEAEKVE